MIKHHNRHESIALSRQTTCYLPGPHIIHRKYHNARSAITETKKKKILLALKRRVQIMISITIYKI